MKVKDCQGCRYFARMYKKAKQKTKNGRTVELFHTYGYCCKHEDRVLNVRSCTKEGRIQRINNYDCVGCFWRNCENFICAYCPNYGDTCHCTEKVKEGETECPYYREVKNESNLFKC